MLLYHMSGVVGGGIATIFGLLSLMHGLDSVHGSEVIS